MSILAKFTMKKSDIKSDYKPTQEERDVRNEIISHFQIGYLIRNEPRQEFNDLSLLQRAQVDRQSFNTYQQNNGYGVEGDVVGSWRSNAIRPVVRNKIISIAAHAVNRMVYPSVTARDSNNDRQQEAAEVMRDLLEYAGEKSGYSYVALQSILAALFSPAALVYSEYSKVMREVKVMKADGSYVKKMIEDAQFSGFHDTVVPVEELFIENFYEHDIQKQGFLIWRRTPSYSSARAKYSAYPNFKYVKPGMQTVFGDANDTFYNAYDPDLRGELVEEIIYWNRAKDVRIIMVNGVVLTKPDAPNPRQDKLYPFSKFGYEFIDEGRCFYFKSLAFKLQSDATIINTLYPLFIDGSILSMYPPTQTIGGDIIAGNVYVPGSNVTLSSPDAQLKPIFTGQNMSQGLAALQNVEQSILDTAQAPVTNDDTGGQTASEILTRKQELDTVMGLFIRMIVEFVLQYQTLRKDDILQYMTVAQASAIDGKDLVYRTFVIDEDATAQKGGKRIQFDGSLPDKMTEDELMTRSMEIYFKEQAQNGDKEAIIRVNPRIFRELEFSIKATPEILQPQSEALERTFVLEQYDRLVANPSANPEETLKMLLQAYPRTRKSPEKFINKQQPQAPMQPQMGDTMGALAGILPQ